jgi:cytidylate kinase
MTREAPERTSPDQEHVMDETPPTEQAGQDRNAGDAGVGPFITISRQFGCYGFSLGLLLMEILNDEAGPEETWKIYHREILERLATETDMAAELLDREQAERPQLLVDFFRSFKKSRIPSGYEIRKRITTIIRGLAMEGHAILIGQGGAQATHDLDHGLWVRLEAPEEWRCREVALREGLSETQARKRVGEMEKQREEIRKLYKKRLPRTPEYHLIYDCSVFTLAQIAQHIVHAMRIKGLA